MEFDLLSGRVIGSALEVHKNLGPGLLESSYEICLAHELSMAGITVERQKALPISYKGIQLDAGYRIDLLVENQLILELKSAAEMSPVFEAQILTYMRLSQIKIGLLINFNVPKLKMGIRRFVL